MCSQCPSKPAIGTVGGQPVCVDCYTKLQNAYVAEQNVRLQQARQAMAMVNYYSGLMDCISGLGPLSPPIQIPSLVSAMLRVSIQVDAPSDESETYIL
jgi:hypothetical protein